MRPEDKSAQPVGRSGWEVVSRDARAEIRPFLITEGGPLYLVEKRLGLIEKNSERKVRTALAAAGLTWLVLLLLSAAQGTAVGHKVTIPFLRDFSEYARFLIAVPILILAEPLIGRRLAQAAEHFITSGVVREENYAEFARAVKQGLKLRDSVVAEIVIAAIAYVIANILFRKYAVRGSSWFAAPSLTWAGWWLALFCVPLINFLVFRWVWRFCLWVQFLARVCRFDLRLFPTHPDLAGGLGFVGEAQRSYGILLFGYSVGIAGVLADLILYDKASIKQFGLIIGLYALVGLAILVLPLSLFAPKLVVTKRQGLHEYGSLATTCTGSFQQKWIGASSPKPDALLGTLDAQSLACMAYSFGIVDQMRFLPINLRGLLLLLTATLLPIAPLALTQVPLKDVVKLLLKFLG